MKWRFGIWRNFANLDPPAPAKAVVNPFAIERPHAAPHLLERQGSFRGLSQLNQSSPFKRQMSLRIGDLPSTVERQQNSLSNEAPSYKSNLIITPGKISLISFLLISLSLYSFCILLRILSPCLLAFCPCLCHYLLGFFFFFSSVICLMHALIPLTCPIESPQPPPRVSRHRMQPSPGQDSSSEWITVLRTFLCCCFLFPACCVYIGTADRRKTFWPNYSLILELVS